MQNRALVIKTYGDPAMCGAILDGINRQMIPLNNMELEAVKAEYNRLKADYDELEARDAVRQKADDERWLETKADLEAQYAVRPHGKVYNTLLLVYAIAWLLIDAAFARLWARIEGKSYTPRRWE